MFSRPAYAGVCAQLVGSALFAALVWGGVPPAVAEEPDSPPARALPQDGLGPGDAVEPSFDVDYDAEPPYDFYERDWRYRMRNYRGSRFSREQRRRWERYPGGHYYGRRSYHYGRSYYPDPYGLGSWGYGGSAFEDGYWHGRRDGRRDAEWERRAERGRASYLNAMRIGYGAFREGDYATAVKQFVLATKLNQGDAASRLQTAHAMVALGHYAEAALAVRRAIQLQPQLVYLSLDIRREYGRKLDFEPHYSKLKTTAEQAEDNADLWFLLGYYQFFSGESAEAHASLVQADKLDPGDRTTARLLEAAKLAAPSEQEPKPVEPNAKPAGAKQPQGQSVSHDSRGTFAGESSRTKNDRPAAADSIICQH